MMPEIALEASSEELLLCVLLDGIEALLTEEFMADGLLLDDLLDVPPDEEPPQPKSELNNMQINICFMEQITQGWRGELCCLRNYLAVN